MKFTANDLNFISTSLEEYGHQLWGLYLKSTDADEKAYIYARWQQAKALYDQIAGRGNNDE